jgi:hypothetical protein
MRLTTSIESWAARFLFTLALTPLASGCGLSSGAGNPGSPVTCDDPQPYLTATDSGYERCSNGIVHRREALSCGAPTATACMNSADAGGAGGGGAAPGGCTTNADCTAFPGGYCEKSSPGCSCIYSCQTDADCGAGNSCECGLYQASCVTSGCKSDADCGGFLCALEQILDAGGCGSTERLECLTAADTCNSSNDCANGAICARANGHLACTASAPDPNACCMGIPGLCGRPFLIEGAARQAAAAHRSDWTAAGQEVRLDGLDADELTALAAHWTRLGLMEHASIAAFARFSLQLLAVGAPPDLVRDAQAAMSDETDHTLLCFALASAYAGRSIGPGRLSLTSALDAQDDRMILITTIREGCIGETLAAIEAAEAAAHAEDPAVRAVLAQIAVDEERHALLAWRYVAWAIAGSPELAAVASAELEAALAEPIATGARDDAMLAHGVTGDARAAEIRRQAMASVIGPAARAMLAS